MSGKSIEIKFPPTASLSRFHASFDGQSASDGRRRRKAEPASSPRGHSGRSAAAPDLFRNALRFIYSRRLPSTASEGPPTLTITVDPRDIAPQKASASHVVLSWYQILA